MEKRAAIYLRVSTEQQTVENQRLDLQRAAKARGLAISATYAERASAAKQRPAFDRMMTDARRDAFDVLVVWSLDRFGRSMAGNVNDALAPTRGAYARWDAACAGEWDEERQADWPASTLASADTERARSMRAEGRSVRAIAMAMRAARSTVARALASPKKLPRKRKHPLAHGHGGQHPVDQVRRGVGHSPPGATGADRASFARERDEQVVAKKRPRRLPAICPRPEREAAPPRQMPPA